MSPSFIYQEISLRSEKMLDPSGKASSIRENTPVLILLAAGKGTRFGTNPKCIAPVRGKPLARHSIDAFHRIFPESPAVCVVGYKYEEVSQALGDDNIYVVSENPVGGTAWAVYETFCNPKLIEKNPIVVISMGDRVVPESIFEKLIAIHSGQESDGTEADLTMLTAQYGSGKIKGKGRIIRDEKNQIVRIMEERDILAYSSPTSETSDGESSRKDDARLTQNALLSLTEGNCPLYVIRARSLMNLLMLLSNDNAQNQYYLTDIIEKIAQRGGTVRSLTIHPTDTAFGILCADITRQDDIPRLEAILETSVHEKDEIATACEKIKKGRPQGQILSIRRQLRELQTAIRREKLAFDPDASFSIGISGGRFRVAFMHPDMGRFYGPAWQIPIGASEEKGIEQIVVFIQKADDKRLHLFPLAEQFRETIDFIETDNDEMYPDSTVSDLYSYEEFGTRMSQRVLLSLGYFSDEELARRRSLDIPLPPEFLWASNNMRRPFSLVGNAVASLRTYRKGEKGEKIANAIGKEHFTGLRMTSTGLIPQGGFSCSSAFTIAVKNALNALYHFDLTDDELIQLAAQAEYGTGVRAGSLDQATVQKGKAGVGTLISSNPRDNYAILGNFPIPVDRFTVIFPYTTPRDSGAWKWSGGFYADVADKNQASGILTTTETRKLTGKIAEIAALILHQPLDVDFFDEICDDLMDDGLLNKENRRKIAEKLLKLPLWISKEDLRQKANAALDFYADELVRCQGLSPERAREQGTKTIDHLFQGWRNPAFRLPNGDLQTGIPLRAMFAYLFGEVAKNFYLIHHVHQWIEYVARSQRGDCCFEIDPDKLPSPQELETELDWEKGLSGEERVAAWLKKTDAVPYDFNRGLDDASLQREDPPVFHLLAGGNFFRGLALVDLAEAFLKRTFGPNAVSVRVNAAGQGDYFQVHIDKTLADPEEVKRFLRLAFYNRFNIHPETDFIEVHAGGGAVGISLSRFSLLDRLIERLEKI